MKAAVLKETGWFEIENVEKPVLPGPEWVLVRTKAVGICGSEIHAFNGTHPFRKPPVVLGHESAGIVVEAGSEAGPLQPGRAVVVDPQWVCGNCSFCTAGDLNLCIDKKFLGTPEWPGAFGEYFTVKHETVFPLPDQLSFSQGAAVEALSVAVHIADRINLRAGQTVAVFGSGAIGGLFSAVAKVRGAARVIIADNQQHCLDTGLDRLGADHACLLPDSNAVRKMLDFAGTAGVDTAVICADDATLLQAAINLVKPRGTVAVVAFLPREELKFMAYDIIRKEVNFVSSYSSNVANFQEAMQLAESGKVDISAVITHELPIEEVQRGFELASTKEDGAIKVVLKFTN